MGVRDYELDQFGVVNNAVYANYFQHAIHDGLERLGIDCDAYARANLGLAITDMRLSYKAPLRSKDRFRVLSGVSRVTGARAVMDEVILKSVTNGDGEEKDMVIAKCQVTMVVLDGDYKATRLPAAIKDVFTTLMQEASASSGGPEYERVPRPTADAGAGTQTRCAATIAVARRQTAPCSQDRSKKSRHNQRACSQTARSGSCTRGKNVSGVCSFDYARRRETR
eukprot:gene8874-3752_t